MTRISRNQAIEILDAIGRGNYLTANDAVEARASAGAFTEGAQRTSDADDERAAREAASEYESKFPTVHRDVTVRRTDHGWVTYDWVTHSRIYPDASKPLPEPSRPVATEAGAFEDGTTKPCVCTMQGTDVPNPGCPICGDTGLIHVEPSRPVATEAGEDARVRALADAVSDLQRSRPLCCYDCGRRYEKGPDLVVSNEDWSRIAPHESGGGVLCPNCMHDRFVALGVPGGSVRAEFKSGPFADDPGRPVAVGSKARAEYAEPTITKAQARELVRRTSRFVIPIVPADDAFESAWAAVTEEKT